MSRRYAIVSIGTNSTRLLLADVEPELPRVELARSVGTRLGEGLGDAASLSDGAIARTLDAIAEYARLAKGHYVRLFVIATSALRRAGNGEQFSGRVAELLGVPPRILSGEEEAAASYRGGLTALEPLRGERVGVLDVGGGSTEYAVGVAGEPERVVSCEIGAVRLTESVPALDGQHGAANDKEVTRARALAREALKPIAECDAVERIACGGGTATVTAAILRGRSTPAVAQPIGRADLAGVLARLVAMPLEERKAVAGMRPQRADILPAGIILIEEAMNILGCDRVIATTSDLLLGYLLQQRDSSAAQRPRHRGAPEQRRGFRP